jgi:hypothetical protein
VAIGVQIRILQRILRLGIVTENGAGGAEEPAIVAPHQNLEGGLIAAANPGREIGVFGRKGGGRAGQRLSLLRI